MSGPADDIAAAEAARVQAEARRQRILEKATKRMDIVSGEQAMEVDEKSASDAKAARIRAARQRRYGKKSAAPKDSTEESGRLNDDIGEPSTANSKPTAEDATLCDTPTATKPEPEESSEEPSWPEDEEVKTESGAFAGEGSKKKYLGVARMRRNALKKRKDASQDITDSGSTTVEDTDLKSIVLDPSKVTKLPIYMHILTILLLFLAGLDVAPRRYHPDVRIERSLSILQNGFPVAHRSLGPVAGTKESLLLDSPPDFMLTDEIQDEFEEREENVPNIDPVFGVNLDELAKGPGITNQLVRGAVGVHRSILYLAYYLPLSVLQTLVGIPQALLRSPPALCLVALVLRHGVGKAILGAGLPGTPNLNEKGIDVVAMAKNFVTNFLSTTFPTAVTIYDVFTHLRSDMYVVLCGVFTGLVYAHMRATISQEGGVGYDASSEEL